MGGLESDIVTCAPGARMFQGIIKELRVGEFHSQVRCHHFPLPLDPWTLSPSGLSIDAPPLVANAQAALRSASKKAFQSHFRVGRNVRCFTALAVPVVIVFMQLVQKHHREIV